MATCIKYKNGHIARLSNDDALAVVVAGAAMFTSKGAWKKYLGDEGRKLYQQQMFAQKLATAHLRAEKPKKEKKRMTKQQRHGQRLVHWQ